MNIIKKVKEAASSLIRSFGKVAVCGAACAVACAASAQLTIIPSPFGGNDNGSFQSFGATNTLVGVANVSQNSTNPAVGLGSGVDVSAFEFATIVFSATNAFSNPSTNVFKIAKGWTAANGSVSYETTPSLPSYTVVVPGNSYVLWSTNLVFTDLAGVGFLALNTLTNTAPNSTNGYYATGTTNFPASGFTNNVGIGVTIGVATKVLHSLR